MKRLMAEKADKEEKLRAAAAIKTKKLEEKFKKDNKAEWIQIKKQQAKDKKEAEKLEKKKHSLSQLSHERNCHDKAISHFILIQVFTLTGEEKPVNKIIQKMN